MGAVAGTVDLDKTHVTTPGGLITATLTDSDLDLAQSIVDKADLTSSANNPDSTTDPENAYAGSDEDGDDAVDDYQFYVTSAGLFSNGLTQYVIRTASAPILDSNSDGIVSSADVVVQNEDGTTSAAAKVFSLNSVEGLVTLSILTAPSSGLNIDTNGSDDGTNEALSFKLSYKAAEIQTHGIKITSSADATGFTLTLGETAAGTGVFVATFLSGGASDATANFTEDFAAGGVDTNGDGKLTAAGDNVDIDGDGNKTDTDLAAGLYETKYGDLNADGDATDIHTSGTFNEVSLGIDLDGDGATTTTAVAAGLHEASYSADLNGDGDETDVLTAFPANGFPDWPNRPTIGAISGSIITSSYVDASPSATRTDTTTVETTDPVVVITSPVHNDATQLVNPRVIAEVTDSDSGVSQATIVFTIVSAVIADGTDIQSDGDSGTDILVGALVQSAITGGYSSESILTNIPAGETVITYRVTADDLAGNSGQSDSDLTTAVVSDDHVLKVDTLPASFASPTGAITGQYWDATAIAIETDVTKAKNTSIRAIFNEDLDGTTIQALDFTVSGVAPQSAEWFSGAASSVFLTVSTQLADAKPAIALVGPISDKAGNSVSTGSVAAAVDGIGPTITITTTPSLSTKTVIVDISGNEGLLTPPSVTINGLATAVPTLVGTNVFRTTFETVAASNSYNVQVTSQDTTGNQVTSGQAAHNTAGAILFEVDNSLPTPTTDPVGSGSVYTSSPFITIDWTAEGTEYGLDSAGALVPSSVNAIATDLDTHDTVTISKATLDGVDVLSQIGTADNRTFILATSGLALGDHTFVINGADDAGNTLAADVSLTFTVKVRPQFTVSLTPGWNLVSLPGQPADSSIDTVIGTIPVDTVLTYDPTTAGGWLTAVRSSSTESFTGTLTTIDAGRAYWVHTSSFESISTDIPSAQAGGAVLLATINVVAGWNLIPVVDITGSLSSGTVLPISAAVYMQGLTVNRIYSYSTTTDQFTNVPTANALIVGQGYWVYFASAGTLVP